jgi:hypothetical protein
MIKIFYLFYIKYCSIFNIKTYHFNYKKLNFDIEEYFYSNLYSELLDKSDFELKDYLLNKFETFNLDI